MRIFVNPIPSISPSKEKQMNVTLTSGSKQKKLHVEVIPEITFDTSTSTQTLQLDDTLGDMRMKTSTLTQSLENPRHDIPKHLPYSETDRVRQIQFRPLRDTSAFTSTLTNACIGKTLDKSIQAKLLEELFPDLAVDASMQTGLLSDLSITSSSSSQALVEVFPDPPLTSSTQTLLLTDTSQDVVLCKSTQTRLLENDLPEFTMDKSTQTQSMVEVLESIISTSLNSQYISSNMELIQSDTVESSETCSSPRVNVSTQASLLIEEVDIGTQTYSLFSLSPEQVNIDTQAYSSLAEKVNIDTQTYSLLEEVNISTQTSSLTAKVDTCTQTSLLIEEVDIGTQTSLLRVQVDIGTQKCLVTEEVHMGTQTSLLTEKVNITGVSSQQEVELRTLITTTPSPTSKEPIDPMVERTSPQLLVQSKDAEGYSTSSPNFSDPQQTCLQANSVTVSLDLMGEDEKVNIHAADIEETTLPLVPLKKKKSLRKHFPMSDQLKAQKAIRTPTQKFHTKSSTLSQLKEEGVGDTNVKPFSPAASLQQKWRPSQSSLTRRKLQATWLRCSTQLIQPKNSSPQQDGIEIASAYYDTPSSVTPMCEQKVSASPPPYSGKRLAKRGFSSSKKGSRLKGPPRLSPFAPPPSPPALPPLVRSRLPEPKTRRFPPRLCAPPSPPPPPILSLPLESPPSMTSPQNPPNSPDTSTQSVSELENFPSQPPASPTASPPLLQGTPVPPFEDSPTSQPFPRSVRLTTAPLGPHLQARRLRHK